MDNDIHLVDDVPSTTTNVFPSSPSTPLPLSGFINGDTVQVNGDTGNLQFSLQFNLRQPQNSDNHFPFPDIITPEKEIQTSSNSSGSTYITPTSTPENEDRDINMADSKFNEEIHNTFFHENDWTPMNEESTPYYKSDSIVTRLRSGVLSPISYSYVPQRSVPLIGGKSRSWNRKKSKKQNGETSDVLATILRRRSLPVRPCNSYSLFVMASWDRVECSSFGETSKRLGEMWGNLSQDEKKVFEEVAVKDNERYKRQCLLLKAHEDEATD